MPLLVERQSRKKFESVYCDSRAAACTKLSFIYRYYVMIRMDDLRSKNVPASTNANHCQVTLRFTN